MRPSLKASLLLSLTVLLAEICQAEQLWPYNLPPHVKYYPEDEPLVRRNFEIEGKLANGPPNAVKKMNDDAGEMFFLEYWGFEEQEQYDIAHYTGSNATMFSPAIRIHDSMPELAPRWYQKRDFSCPAGTNSCTSINRPNSCCQDGLTCNIVADSGLGDVGCCKDSGNCGGQSSSCPQDYTSCPSDSGGGCCIPGYACQGVGCVLTSTTVVVVSPTPTSTSTSSTSTSTSTSTTSSADPTTSSSTPPPTTTSSSSTRPTTTTCSTGFRSCPVSLGGGCCPTDRECGSRTCPPSSTTAPSTTPSEAAPVRPTSNVSPSSASPTPTSTTPSACPQNFYACSAYYPGAGCCQVGRDCSSTSCPGRATTSILVSNGVTVVAEPTTGVCASDWSSCPATVGGGCCPSGYGCGTESCTRGTAAASSSPTGVAKQGEQNGASQIGPGRWLAVVTVLLGLVILV